MLDAKFKSKSKNDNKTMANFFREFSLNFLIAKAYRRNWYLEHIFTKLCETCLTVIFRKEWCYIITIFLIQDLF